MTKIFAKDQKCCNCNNQAVAFWPCIDPDIKSYPYCRECLGDQHVKYLLGIFEIDREFSGGLDSSPEKDLTNAD